MRYSIAIVMTFLLATAPLHGDLRATVGRETRLQLRGTTNVGPWKCVGEHVDVTLDLAATAAEISKVLDAIDHDVRSAEKSSSLEAMPSPKLRLVIPVRTLECGNARMEHDLYTALKETQYRNIVFEFERVVHAKVVKAGRYSLRAAGRLTLAGKSRPIVLNLDAQRLKPTEFRFRGELPLKMSDFGVTPPVAMMGLIRARDDLTVNINLQIALK